ncbi:MAG: hypothetical protein WAX80_00840 [Minisyncoccia bacterium]
MPDETPPNIDVPVEAPTEPQPQTAQVPPSEPLPPEPVSETKQVESEPESVETDSIPAPASSPAQAEPVVILPKPSIARDLLNKARFAIQTRKRVKLDRIMSLFAKRTNITNDEVEKFLHVSDATATRYLEILEKENKIKQTGKTGKGVSYSKI